MTPLPTPTDAELDELERELRVMADAHDMHAKRSPIVTVAYYSNRHRVFLAAIRALREDRDYLEWRLTEIVPLFQEARDALPAINITTAKLRGIDLSLADRMDTAGTRTRAEFSANRTPSRTEDLG